MESELQSIIEASGSMAVLSIPSNYFEMLRQS